MKRSRTGKPRLRVLRSSLALGAMAGVVLVGTVLVLQHRSPPAAEVATTARTARRAPTLADSRAAIAAHLATQPAPAPKGVLLANGARFLAAPAASLAECPFPLRSPAQEPWPLDSQRKATPAVLYGARDGQGEPPEARVAIVWDELPPGVICDAAPAGSPPPRYRFPTRPRDPSDFIAPLGSTFRFGMQTAPGISCTLTCLTSDVVRQGPATKVTGPDGTVEWLIDGVATSPSDGAARIQITGFFQGSPRVTPGTVYRATEINLSANGLTLTATTTFEPTLDASTYRLLSFPWQVTRTGGVNAEFRTFQTFNGGFTGTLKLAGRYTVRTTVTGGDTVGSSGTFLERSTTVSEPAPVEQHPTPYPLQCPPVAINGPGRAIMEASGEELLEATDLFVRGRGEIDFVLSRTYRSGVQYRGPLGHGWTMSFDEHLAFLGNGDVTHVDGFGSAKTFTKNPDGSFTAPREVFLVLRREPDESFVLRDAHGFKRRFNDLGQLVAREDRKANRMTFTRSAETGQLDKAIDPLGREYQFFWSGDATLQGVVDSTGRLVVYTLDGNADLVEVRSPVVVSSTDSFPEGRVTKYTYSSGFADERLNHNVLTRTQPTEVGIAGPPDLVLTYGENLADPDTFDRVLTATVGGTNASGVAAGGVYTMTYAAVTNPGAEPVPNLPQDVVRKTTTLDPEGNTNLTYVDALNRLRLKAHLPRGLRPNEEPHACSCGIYEYDEDSLVVREKKDLGGYVEYLFDKANPNRLSQRNLLERRVIPDATRGGTEPLVTRFTYEPLFNLVASVTDPRELSASFVPSLGTNGPGRYTRTFKFDYQESTTVVPEAVDFGIDLAGVARGLGDLNGDGRTDQQQGNVVELRAPNVTLLATSRLAVLGGSTTQTILTQQQWNDAGQLVRSIGPEGDVLDLDYHPENQPGGPGTEVPGNVSNAPRGYLKTSIVDAGPSPRRTSAVPPRQLTSAYLYDGYGNVRQATNPRGIGSVFEWNQANELCRVERAALVDQALSSGQLLVSGAIGYVTKHFHDANGRTIRTEIENRDGNAPELGAFIERTFEYDILDHVVSATARVDVASSLTTTYRYTKNEKLALVTFPEGNKVKTEYDQDDLVFKVTRGPGTPQESTVTYNYDHNDNLVEILDAEHAAPGGGGPAKTTFVYDGYDRLVATIDKLGQRSEADLDPVSQVVARRVFGYLPQGTTPVLQSDVRFVRDELSRVYERNDSLFVAQGFTPVRPVDLREGSLTPADGLVTTRTEHDALSRARFVIQDDGQTHEVRFDGASRVVARFDPLQNRVETDYDQGSNPVRVRSIEVSPEALVPAETFETVYVWDARDRLVRLTDNAGQTATLTFDSRDNLIATSDPVGPPIADPLGLYTRGTINDAGNTVTHFHDGLGRVVRTVRDLREGGQGGAGVTGTITTRNVWDGNSRLHQRLDDKNQATTFDFDDLDRLVKETSADGTFRTWEYTRNDMPFRTTDANGTVVQRTFDVLDRPFAVDVIATNPTWSVGGTYSQHFSYDAFGRVVTAEDFAPAGTVTTTRVFDSLGRVLEDQQDGYVVSNVWAGDGRRLSCTYSGDTVVQFGHDAAQRVKTISQGFSTIAAWDYIGPGYRPLRCAGENGITRTHLDPTGTQDTGWDAVKRMASVKFVNPQGVAVVDLNYTYDRAGNQTSATRGHDGGRQDVFAYDSTYRLGVATYDAGVPIPTIPTPGVKGVTQEVFNFDGVGNRVTVVQTLDELKPNGNPKKKTLDYTVNSLNQYTQVENKAHVHDLAGNLRSDGVFTYRYDFLNRLIQLEKPGNATVRYYRYDAFGRRVQKTWGPAAPDDPENPGDDDEPTIVGEPKVQRYVFDGEEIVEQRRGDGALKKEWVHGTGIDEPLRMSKVHANGSRTHFYYHQDANGNVVALTNSTSGVVERYRYLAFGKEEIIDPAGNKLAGSAVGNAIRWQGRWRDQAEGSPLYFFRARMYHPGVGRFVQRDPVFDPANVGSQYAFGGNGPISHVDPDGLQGEGTTDANKQKKLERIKKTFNERVEQLKKTALWPQFGGKVKGLQFKFLTEEEWAKLPSRCPIAEDKALAALDSYDPETGIATVNIRLSKWEDKLDRLAGFDWGQHDFEQQVDMIILHEAFHAQAEMKRKEKDPTSVATDEELRTEHKDIATRFDELKAKSEEARAKKDPKTDPSLYDPASKSPLYDKKWIENSLEGAKQQAEKK